MGITSSFTTSNFSEELHFKIDDVLHCEYLTYTLLKEKKYHMIYTSQAKMLLHQMDKCHYIHAHLYNSKHRLVLTLVNGDMIEVALSDCGRFIGKPCHATKLSKWYYIVNDEKEKTNPFAYLLK